MNTIVLTTCSANHLAQAKNLCDSVVQHNPSYQCFIGLVDRIDQRFATSDFAPHIIIEAHELKLASFSEMVSRYNVFELNCAMKSFFSTYLLENFNPRHLIYLDSDILVFDSLEVIVDELKTHSFLVNPHTTKSYPADGALPDDRGLLQAGIYNAGFFALRHNDQSREILNWLNQKMVDQCYDNPAAGLFVDQKWYNLIPVLFREVGIFTHPGCNVAYWNFHEREVKKAGGRFTVNGELLVFFHFSGYSMDHPERISKHQTRFSEVNEDVKQLMQIYHQALERSGHQNMLLLENVYIKKKKSFTKKLKGLFKAQIFFSYWLMFQCFPEILLSSF